jgi:beta-xylosidase/pectin methylesterase-like acyl-CoA thioesterase
MITSLLLAAAFQIRYAAVVDAKLAGPDSTVVDGIPTYRTLGAALSGSSANGGPRAVIFIRNGRYREKLTVDRPRVTLVGESRDGSILTYDAAAGTPTPFGSTFGTRGSYTLRIIAPDFRAERLTIENGFDYLTNAAKPDSDRTKVRDAQGVALMLDLGSDRASFEQVRITGHQDTLFPNSGRSYFHDCVIEGSVDFIFGAGQAVFDECRIVSRDRGSRTNNGYITAPSTGARSPYGFLFYRSRLEKERREMAPATVVLGRPWHPFGDPNVNGSAVFVECWMDDHVGEKGWDRMSMTDSTGNRTWWEPETARFYEYGNTGPGAVKSGRRRVLTATEAKQYTVANVLGGWRPPRGDTASRRPESSSAAARYVNPVIFADYSDPDVVRVGDDFWMTASSFNAVPALPILHSTDLVRWTLVNYAVDRLPVEFDAPQHGNGVWAPAIRYHDGAFYIFYGDPDRGIYMVKTRDPRGRWDAPVLVRAAKGWIDPAPFWDDDGNAYLVHAFANSRAGVKSILHVNRMSADGTRLLDEGTLVFDGHASHPTIEGPKLYKRNGWYYIFAPAGGVGTGWQTVLRSRRVLGPYEDRVVMRQGNTPINGPHQGGWVELPNGEGWFVHFQDRGVYGRVVHLQPLAWSGDWPVIGADVDGDGVGEPVLEQHAPDVARRDWPGASDMTQLSDAFDVPRLALQWQWQANDQPGWFSLTANPGTLRLYAQPAPGGSTNLWPIPNLLLQKLSAPSFTATATLSAHAAVPGETFGLVLMGLDYAYIAVRRTATGYEIVRAGAKDADKLTAERVDARVPLPSGVVQLRVTMADGGASRFSYSVDGRRFTPIGDAFIAREGKWIGAKVGLFAVSTSSQEQRGYADVDSFRIH